MSFNWDFHLPPRVWVYSWGFFKLRNNETLGKIKRVLEQAIRFKYKEISAQTNRDSRESKF